MCKGSVEGEDLPPQITFSDTNISDLTALPRGYTHTDFLRRLVLRGKYEDETTRTALVVLVADGQRLYNHYKKAVHIVVLFVSCICKHACPVASNVACTSHVVTIHIHITITRRTSLPSHSLRSG